MSIGQSVARWIATATIAAAICAAFVPRAEAESCGPHPAAVNFKFELPKPSIDNSRPQPDLQQMGRKRETQDHEGLILGLYVAEMRLDLKTNFEIATKGASACVRMNEVEVDFALQNRRIYIVNQWRSGTCPYTAILAHERKHESTDERILREKTPIAKRRIADALSRASTAAIPASQVESQKQRLFKIVEDVLKKFNDEMQSARTAAQRAIDAGREYQRVAEACAEFRRGA